MSLGLWEADREDQRKMGRDRQTPKHLTDMEVTLNLAMFLAVSPQGGVRAEDKSESEWKLEWSGNWARHIYLNCARAINYQEFKERRIYSLHPLSK